VRSQGCLHAVSTMTTTRTLVLLVSSALSTNALLLPSALLHSRVCRTSPPTMQSSFQWDSGDFLNNPILYIAENPQYFSPEMQAMAAYQIKVKGGEMRLWGDLPEALDLCAKGGEYLRQKSAAADDLARTIVHADQNDLQKMTQDSNFAEKKAFFQNIAALPRDNNGMLAINYVASTMIERGELPLISQFDEDIKRITKKVNDVNEELYELDRKYTALFLSVRKVSKLASAAANAAEQVG